MSQRNVLENSIQTLNTLRGPAKILYAPGTLPMPVRLEQILSPTTGAAATGWNTFGLTRGGINVNKNQEVTPRDDVDQIIGVYDTDITGRSYTVTSQMAEVLDNTQFGIAYDLGTPTVVSTTGATQVMIPLDSGSNKPINRRLAVVYPKGEEGKALAFVFRQAQVGGGEKTFRFDKTDPASPPIEFNVIPELATTIDAQDSYGRWYEIL